MNDKYKFKHELPKNDLRGKASSPDCLAKLLTQLLGINEAEAGKLVYDACIGVGGLSSHVDTNKHILIGDDKEKEYLKRAQKNNPDAALFNHDTFFCQKGVPCYEHLKTQKWIKAVDREISKRESELNEVEAQKEYDRLMALNLTEEQTKEMLEKQEALLKQRTLEYLIIKKQEELKETNLKSNGK